MTPSSGNASILLQNVVMGDHVPPAASLAFSAGTARSVRQDRNISSYQSYTLCRAPRNRLTENVG